MWLNEHGREQKVVFSGDLGQYDTPILNDPAVITSADHVLIESTYGDRRHRDRQQTLDEIGAIICEARHERDNLLIPAFSSGRTQEILYYVGLYYEEWEMDRWKVFLDSPMAINNIKSGAIIIAGSGMCNGGRIIHHLKHNISRKGAHVMIVGYQAYGTPGRKLVEGAKQIKIHGDSYPVRARVHTVGGLSAHADVDDLLRWARNFESQPRRHVIHGEPVAKQAFRDRLEQESGLHTRVPQAGEILVL